MTDSVDPPPAEPRKRVLVTGGKGFIVCCSMMGESCAARLIIICQGGHVARSLLRLGHFVRVADLPGPSHWHDVPDGLEIVEGDLRDRDFCRRVVRGVDWVLHFAANMGGMGVIHEDNELRIYEENDAMLLNVLEISAETGVTKF